MPLTPLLPACRLRSTCDVLASVAARTTVRCLVVGEPGPLALDFDSPLTVATVTGWKERIYRVTYGR